MNKGLTIFEILLAITLIAALAFITVNSFFGLRDKQLLDNTASEIISMIDEARNSTLSSLNDTTYGIHIEEFKVVLFEGTDFNDSDSSNKEYELDSRVHISDIDLTGDVSEINFARLTGDTDDRGTITISLQNSNASSTRVIRVDQVGVVERSSN